MLQALFGLPDIARADDGGLHDRHARGVARAPARARAASGATAWTAWRADARAAYRRIVYDDPRFLDYFHASTPEAEIGGLNIGSRPARRGGASERGRRCAPSPGSSPGRRRA